MTKKHLLLLLMLNIVSVLSAQELNFPETISVTIGEFKASDQMFTAEADISTDTSLVCIYRLPATHAYPQNFYYDYAPVIHIICTTTMKEELLKIAAIYREWTETAKSNNVGKMQKVIEQEFPVFMLSLHKKAKGYPKYLEAKNNKFTFSVFNTQKPPSIFCNQTFKDDVLGITTSTGLAFRTPEEFEAFIEFLDPEKVKQRIREGKTTLFPQNEASKTNDVSKEVPSQPQSTSTKTNSSRQSVDKGKIARGALDRWIDAAKRTSGTK